MKFYIGAIPETPSFPLDVSWKLLREPSPLASQLWALPLGLIVCVVIEALWFSLTPLREAPFIAHGPGIIAGGIEHVMQGVVMVLRGFGLRGVWLFIPVSLLVTALTACLATLAIGIMLGGIIPVHELLHAAVHPRFGLSDASVLGLWPSKGMFYAHYVGELSRARLITVFIMPLLLLSFLPLSVCAAVHRSSILLASISILNALASSVDILGIALLLFQVPGNAGVRNQGWKTYWKVHGAGKQSEQSGRRPKPTADNRA